MYGDVKKKDIFGVLVTLFAVNHFILFFFVFQTFKHHTMALRLSDNAHGFVTFVCIQLLPLALWAFNSLNRVLYTCIILHLLNVSYFIMETFYNKITPDELRPLMLLKQK